MKRKKANNGYHLAAVRWARGGRVHDPGVEVMSMGMEQEAFLSELFGKGVIIPSLKGW